MEYYNAEQKTNTGRLPSKYKAFICSYGWKTRPCNIVHQKVLAGYCKQAHSSFAFSWNDDTGLSTPWHKIL